MDLSQLKEIQTVVVQKKWEEVEKIFNSSIQLQHMQIRISLEQPDQPVVIIDPVTPLHAGGIGSKAVNGGVISMVSDLAIGLLGLSFFEHGMTATHHLNIHFVRPLVTNRLKAVAKVDQVVGKRIFGKVEIYNDLEEICAYATGIVVFGIHIANLHDGTK